YASNPGKSVQQSSAEDTKALTGPKEKRQTSYTHDGRLVVDGKIVKGKEAASLWTGVLLRTAIKKMPLVNGEKVKDKEKREEREEITPSNEPIITTAPPPRKKSSQEESSQ
ncbi:hypothetical protein PMAYCL1PPCAC_15663, partial [Pristionchus mayeri]